MATIVLILALVLGASLLPPDTSLRLVRERGVLRVCIPNSYPPLVTNSQNMPGIDVEIMRLVASDLGVRLQLVNVPAIGQDFNPRNWRITRAQCQLVAGGVVLTQMTRSFLETTPSHLATGWAIAYPQRFSGSTLSSANVAFVSGVAGLDRVALSSYLRVAEASVSVFQDPSSALNEVASGSFDAIATEALLARQMVADREWTAAYLPQPLERYPLGFGLWKGDLTLKRAVSNSLLSLKADGTIDAIIDSYDLASIESDCPVCPSTR